MARAGRAPAARRVWSAAAGLVACLATSQGLAAQARDVVIDIVTNPQKYWNRTVTIRGHVRTVTADPPGTTRGTYVIRDSSEWDLTVDTNDLPSPGREF